MLQDLCFAHVRLDADHAKLLVDLLIALVLQHTDRNCWDINANAPQEYQQRNAVQSANADMALPAFTGDLIVKLPRPAFGVHHFLCIRQGLLLQKLSDVHAVPLLSMYFHHSVL